MKRAVQVLMVAGLVAVASCTLPPVQTYPIPPAFPAVGPVFEPDLEVVGTPGRGERGGSVGGVAEEVTVRGIDTD
jgi:hypothetical protein